MNEIDLSKYAGKEAICYLSDGQTPSSFVDIFNASDNYLYMIAGWTFNKTGKGFSKPPIKSIQLKNAMTGIAQQYPNINLEDFEGQRCYVKWNSGEEAIGCVKSLNYFWEVPGPCRSSFKKDGTHSHLTPYVEEIYGEGAFDVTTKDTFDAPSDDVVTTATAVLKGLTEDQIAKVLHALKNK